MERGSRKHVLDWTATPEFFSEFESLLAPLPVKIPHDAALMPRGYDSPVEARLERFGPEALPHLTIWDELQDWWLVHKRGATTPNWDIAMNCTIEDRDGLILVEAKANWPELGKGGKPLSASASSRSLENHARIGQAIEEARSGWQEIDTAVTISRDTHYQLSNRLAFTWKLGTLGIPVILVYLGFTGDEGLRGELEPYDDDTDWRRAFSEYADGVVPMDLFEVRHELKAAPVWMTLRSREVIEDSDPVS